ncbi:MAG TPA: 6-pyruvoyl-tetrahydropterin synthase-related protein [Vicinamibacteria bacterium]|nr:6-pyruvoyl-tetrahydropterin synthase-related protein [Vicinamibacteria bacterium]
MTEGRARAVPRLPLADVLTAVSVLAVWGLLASFFPPSLLLLDTMTAGGDTPSFHHPIAYLRDVLVPAGFPRGWNPGNFGGYAPYQFYFLPPSLAVTGLSTLMPFNVAFKLVTVTGIFLLPLATALCVRLLGYPFPIPALGAAASLLFLFNQGNSMWGGNIPSTLAGEFSFSISFALAALFLGLVFHAVQRDRGRRPLAALLALVGLCHPLPFLTAAAGSLYFLLDRTRLRRNLVFLSWTYGIAALLMAFWLLPLLAGLRYTTSIHWVWQFQSWTEIVPPFLLPAAVLAVVNLARIAIRRGQVPEAPRYLAFCLFITVVAFCNATSLGIPDIRFIPYAQLLLVLLALDLVALVLPRLPAPALPGMALVAAILGWVQHAPGYVGDWVKWNYEGIERKRGYEALRQITGALKGRLTDPRVGYEHSPTYEVFGSMRIFESLPLLAGRATLEGVLLQTPVTAPFVYYLQALMSAQGTHVIPDYRYPATDPARGAPRLDLFNVRDFLATTDVVKAALDEDPAWRRSFSLEPYVIYTRTSPPGGYVRVPRHRPVRVETTAWKKDFHRWFDTDGVLDVPIVRAADVPAADERHFPLRSASPTDLPRVPLPSDCLVHESLSALSIEFTTTCPGVPHWISMAYHPNWRAEGASRVYLASPAFMIVVPEGNTVRLKFARTAVDWLGLLGTALGVGLCLGLGRARMAATTPAPAAATSRAVRRLQVGVLSVVVAVTGWNLTRTIGAHYFHLRGWTAFKRGEYREAQREFERALVFGLHTGSASDALFYRAASLFRAGDLAAAERAYQDVLARKPDSVWVAESLYNVGLSQQRQGRTAEAAATYRRVLAEHRGNVWARHAAERLREMTPPPGAEPR